VTVAYVDTSWVAAIVFGERAADSMAKRLTTFDAVVSSNLLEAELRSALTREGVDAEPEGLESIAWILPDRTLEPEIKRVLAAGYVRGADCWHLASALFVAPAPGQLTFLTRDQAQAAAARKLGFRL
jgi:predicted nucleic acid-binding protein